MPIDRTVICGYRRSGMDQPVLKTLVVAFRMGSSLSQFPAAEDRPNDLHPTGASSDHFLVQMDRRVRVAHDKFQLVADFKGVVRLIPVNPGAHC